MGGGGSKQAQLERYGHLLSPRERHAVETTFTDIAGSPDASFLTQQQLNAYLTGLLYPPSTTDRVSRGIFLALGGGDKAGVDFPNFIQFASQLLRGSLTQRSQRLHILTSGHLDLLRETLQALLANLCDSSSPSSSLLSAAALLMINSFLPAEIRGQLYPLFLSSQHGKSFSTLCKGLVGSGPCLLVVRDYGGHVFGGFAAVSWQFGPQFTGSSECFLFSLHPNMAVYTVTGYNDHYMYLQQTAQTMPNGLGMGGQLEYCGLWLSAEFDSGHSKGRPHCTTYGSPSLSSSEEFSVDTVEVWHVGSPPPPPEQSDGAGQSILDKDKVAGHILEMAGKTRHSEGLREPPPDDN
ncbi:MTOR-associated protein MEAK7 [Geodia barretti]|uniref:MTOR-associated protein MEAK7 n=1 Tax=Geodia barretti TaxID=519541 RepID=A0AA35SSU3_GEOBA|nr:MTOR-associated protein MEAK7 [Geodia barretti]